ncbi:MFS general substrate transporter [Penicillium angulare]|uniref:MFS general substrate transporter n=1 Tax=Penicillium angulare TaxID=116970 RepID=A0A9W9JZV3_9EURO|nr:MFS general substrate transporter [Penicillium angulare]
MANKPSVFRLVTSRSLVTEEVSEYNYSGKGIPDEPYAVDFIPDDPRNPMLFSQPMKWCITVIMAFGTLAVSFESAVMSGSIKQVEIDLNAGTEVSVLTVSLYVLGFAIGPMTWAPLSEMFGRQMIYLISFGLCTVFGACSIASQNITTLLVLRFFAGCCGASAVVNAAAVIGDIFSARERGLALIVFCSAPFMGPTLGPICGGFLGQAAGWRWVDALGVIFCAVMWVIGVIFVPETYAPYILQRRAAKLSKITTSVYMSKLEVERAPKTLIEVLKVALIRPWMMLFFEPIVLLLSIYTAIVYGILYMQFAAFPIVFENSRHWSQGISGLSFLGVLVGQILAFFIYLVFDARYKKTLTRAGGRHPPEERLWSAMLGGVLLPIGLFWFAWTIYDSVHWIVPLIGTSLFGIGQVLLFISLINYTVDAYTVFAASSLAANAILRALFGFAFPMFTTQMFENLGYHWAASVPAFLSLVCMPVPFLFYKYGARIRSLCKFATEADKIMTALLGQMNAAATAKKDDLEKQDGMVVNAATKPSSDAE